MNAYKQSANQINTIRALDIFFVIVGTIFVAARLYTKRIILKALDWDDGLLFAAYVLGLALYGMYVKAAELGLDSSLLGLSQEEAILVFRLSIAIRALYMLAQLCLKLSLFVTYLRVFSVSRTMKWLCWIGISACILVYTAAFFASIFGCGTPSSELAGLVTCQYTGGLAPVYTWGLFSALSDLYITLIPIPSVIALKLPWQKKLGVASVFSLGFGCTIVTFVRVAIGVTVSNPNNITHVLAASVILNYVEILVGIVAVSSLVLPAFIKGAMKPTFKSLTRYTTQLHHVKRSDKNRTRTMREWFSRHESNSSTGNSSEQLIRDEPREKRATLESVAIRQLRTDSLDSIHLV